MFLLLATLDVYENSWVWLWPKLLFAKKIQNLFKLVENSFQIVTLQIPSRLCSSWLSSQVLLPPPKAESSRLSAPPEPGRTPFGKGFFPHTCKLQAHFGWSRVAQHGWRGRCTTSRSTVSLQSWGGKSTLSWGLDEPEISVQGHSVLLLRHVQNSGCFCLQMGFWLLPLLPWLFGIVTGSNLMWVWEIHINSVTVPLNLWFFMSLTLSSSQGFGECLWDPWRALAGGQSGCPSVTCSCFWVWARDSSHLHQVFRGIAGAPKKYQFLFLHYK